MLLPHTHAWTYFQKCLIIGATMTVLAVCGAGIYSYEQHCRTSDVVLVGTWAFRPLGGGDIYFRLDPDHTFRVSAKPLGDTSPAMQGIWFAGGDFLYMRQPFHDDDGSLIDHPLLIWRLEDISANQLQVRLNPGGLPRTVRHVSTPSR